jgi:alkylation response protein AidB-like acyl-CoA dehydrogenase
MDLDFTEEQDMLRDLVRGICSAYSSAEAVRAIEDDPVGFPAELWKQLADVDLIGLMLPTEYGGSGMSALEGAVVYEEFGRALAPTPHFVSAVMSAGVLLRAGSDEQKQAWLPRIATGDAILTTAWLEPRHGFGPDGVQTTARPATSEADGDRYVLDGTKWHVPFASAADQFVVLARTPDGVDLFLVDPAAAGVAMTQQLTIASDAQYEVELSGVSVPAANRIGGAGTGWATWHETLLDGIVLLAAYAMGGARFALDTTVQYAKDRQQFDKPLGAFQAIAHYLADASTAVNGGTILVHEAAWASANGHSIDRLAPMAKLFACQTFRDVTAMGHQVHGGMGFTVECDMQLYFRRAKELQISWWNDRYLEELIAAATLDRDDVPPVRR